MKAVNILVWVALLILGFFVGTSWEAIAQTGNKSDVLTYNQKKSNSTGRDVDPITRIYDVEAATINLFEEVSPSVVFIKTSKVERNYWNRNELQIPSGSGSGFIWDEEGHIVTNYHVVDGADGLTVTLSNQEVYSATLKGYEASKDIAVLKINAPREVLKAIKVGSYDDLRVGQSVFAIGNPFGLDHSLTTGIISALGREITSVSGRPIKDVIQTDAAINPGNSGGPLLDSSSRLIGVNTMIYSPSGASAGIGFSIPVDVVNWVVPDIIRYGRVKRPLLGIVMVQQQIVNRFEIEGAMIAEVNRGSGAEVAGLRGVTIDQTGYQQPGDVIINIEGQKVTSNNDLFLVLERYKPGEKVEIVFIRDNQKKITQVTLDSSLNY